MLIIAYLLRSFGHDFVYGRVKTSQKYAYVIRFWPLMNILILGHIDSFHFQSGLPQVRMKETK